MKTSFKYLEPYAQREQQRFYLAGVGLREEMEPQFINRPNGTWDWLLMFFHAPVVIKVDGRTSIFPEDTLMIWNDTQGHYYGNSDCRWSHSWIHFQGSVANTFIEQAGLTTGVYPSLDINTILETYLPLMYRERLRHDHSMPVLEHLFQSLLYEIGRVFMPDSPRLTKPIQVARQHMDTHYDEQIQLGDLCALTAMSKPHLISEFRRQVGIPPIDYLIRTRLEHARSLLLNRNLSVTQVAERVGYTDIYHFSKLFKKRMGKSPSAFRE